MYGSIFPDDSEAAFSNYRLWESIGFIIALAYSTFICVYIKIYVCLGFIVLGLSGYICVELLHRKEKKEDSEETIDDEVATFANLANVARRKSSVFIPEKTVQQAAEVIRRKSVQHFLNEEVPNLIKRKLSTFVPMVTVEEIPEESSNNASPDSTRRPSYLVSTLDPLVASKHKNIDCESPRIYRPNKQRKISDPTKPDSSMNQANPKIQLLRSLSENDGNPCERN